jgi:hypothetical protein
VTRLALATAGQLLHKSQTYNVSIRPCHDVHDVLHHPRGVEVDVGLPILTPDLGQLVSHVDHAAPLVEGSHDVK